MRPVSDGYYLSVRRFNLRLQLYHQLRTPENKQFYTEIPQDLADNHEFYSKHIDCLSKHNTFFALGYGMTQLSVVMSIVLYKS